MFFYLDITPRPLPPPKFGLQSMMFFEFRVILYLAPFPSLWQSFLNFQFFLQNQNMGLNCIGCNISFGK
jgi:hypothetical protein